MHPKCVFIVAFIVHTVGARYYDIDRDEYVANRRGMLEQDDDHLIQQLRELFLNHENRSWQGYVDGQLVGKGLSQAAIIGNADGNIWAASDSFNLKPGEGRGIVGLFKNPNTAFQNGITVNGVKYVTVKTDDRSICEKKGTGDVVIVKTDQAIVIGVYDEKLQPGNAAVIVEQLPDYLMKKGY